ncbi:MerR family transcriptional regulator [Pedobacter sp. SD-b]|uniref:MerR family transcriptional regulator n=1 Tax=Pedobacter segetis TaxID=2793069 RepID=A0ABS1BK69_9SPHI|nr:MerR family transcriptional regulator [Pedobacter segetis]MBK0383172.1 MerR family transcriptional regulator [Pedobacter segetis]
MRKFSISDIENLTGIKAHTIRVWEQRYNFFTPKRTETNIRYYDDHDLCKFLNIAALNESGYKISRISKMDNAEINLLVKKLQEDHYNINVQVQMLSNAMLKMDDHEFDEVLNGCVNDLGMEKAICEIIFPFMRKVGFMWQVGTINAAHEHFATQKIEQKIIHDTYELKSAKNENSKRFILFLPPQEHHEVGLLFAQYLLKNNGHRALYLGQDMPFESLGEVVEYYEPDFVFTVLTIANSEIKLEDLIHKIKEKINDTPLILAGAQISCNTFSPIPNTIFIKNIQEFIDQVHHLNGSAYK